MTSKPDWADEIANEIERSFEDGVLGFDAKRQRVLLPHEFCAAALRKAKADGAREAAEIVHSPCMNLDESTWRYNTASALKNHADKIERGEYDRLGG